MSRPGWNRLGVVGESRFVAKAYCAPADAIVVQFERNIDTTSRVIHSLYSRVRSEPNYRRLTPTSDVLDYRNFLVSPEVPYVVVNVLELLAYENEVNVADWHSLQIIELANSHATRTLKLNDLIIDRPHRRAWVDELMAVQDGIGTIYCSIALESKASDETWRAEYWLSSICTQTGKVELLSQLEGVFI